jgi:transcriptional antiterminator RfaH
MPILEAEPSVYPPDLFAEEPSEQFHGRDWRVLHVKPRQEKSLAREMCARETPFYLPLLRGRTVIRGRAVPSLAPCFPGYVFTLGTHDEWLAALGTRRVVRSLAVHDPAELWDDLRQIHRLLASDARITPEGCFMPGTPVEIRSGPLAGLRGVVTQTASGRRVWVQVNFIQRGVSVLLDDNVLVAAPTLAR